MYIYQMKVEFPNLDACNPSICFSGRMMRMDRIVSKIFRKHLASFNLTNSQFSILFITSKKRVVTQQKLADMLYLEKSSVSRNMKRLLDAEFIRKTTTRQIEMTTKGKKLLEQLIPKWENAMQEVNEILGEEGQIAFNTLYTKITN